MSTSTSGVTRFPLFSVGTAIVMAAMIVAAVITSPAAAGTVASPSHLQSMVNDLGLQIDMRYRASMTERQQRIDQLAQAIAGWNASARSTSDRAALESWLREATLSSMPGSVAPMPAVPQFDKPQPKTMADATVAPVGVVTNKPVVPDQPSASEQLPAPGTSADKQAAPAKPTSTQQPVTKETSVMQPAQAPSSSPQAQAPATTMPATPVESQATPAPSPINPVADKTAGEASGDKLDFWLGHPAATELPGDLQLDDPFQDDPAPDDSSLRDLPSLFD